MKRYNVHNNKTGESRTIEADSPREAAVIAYVGRYSPMVRVDYRCDPLTILAGPWEVSAGCEPDATQRILDARDRFSRGWRIRARRKRRSRRAAYLAKRKGKRIQALVTMADAQPARRGRLPVGLPAGWFQSQDIKRRRTDEADRIDDRLWQQVAD